MPGRSDPKAELLRYLRSAREALVWKLDGLSEYDVRRPLTPTGTHLPGLVEHAAGVEPACFGDTFARPYFTEEPPPWWQTEDAEPNADMWATAEEPREQIVGLCHRAWEHSNRTIEALALDAAGQVPWWPWGRREVTLHHILVRVLSDTHRHAGHADIVRELIDGTVGMGKDNDGMPPGDQVWWASHRSRLEQVGRDAGRG
ncbi:DinB family protein [Streptomyces cucumeris]|uniref:DinB family protein n=1 Tax=Streptomyces cucumeris TaxID=2962890 RepID=UPI003D72940A